MCLCACADRDVESYCNNIVCLSACIWCCVCVWVYVYINWTRTYSVAVTNVCVFVTLNVTVTTLWVCDFNDIFLCVCVCVHVCTLSRIYLYSIFRLKYTRLIVKIKGSLPRLFVLHKCHHYDLLYFEKDMYYQGAIRFTSTMISASRRGIKYAESITCWEVNPPHKKRMLNSIWWWVLSTPSLLLLPGPLRPGVVVPIKVPSVSQIDQFLNYLTWIRVQKINLFRNNCIKNVNI